MEYKVVVLPTAETDLGRLPDAVRTAILRRLEWLRLGAHTIVHHRLHGMPPDLAGLCRIRYGDYRILYWHYRGDRVLKVYRVQHRSEVYRGL